MRLLSVFRGSVREILWSRQRKVHGFGSLDDLGEHHEVFQAAFHISCKAVGFHSNLVSLSVFRVYWSDVGYPPFL